MKIDSLREFVVLFDTANYTETAMRLHISKSALSKHIAAIEEEIGVPLFTNTTPITPTPAGTVFYDYAVSVSERLKVVSRHCRNIGTRFPRFVTVALLSYVRDEAYTRLENALNTLAKETGDSFVLTKIGMSPDDLFTSLAREAYDFIIYPSIIPPEEILLTYDASNLEFIPLARDRLVVPTSKGSLFEGRQEIHMKELASEEFLCIGGSRNHQKLHIVFEMLSNIGVTPNFRYDNFSNSTRDLDLEIVMHSTQIIPISIFKHDSAYRGFSYATIADAPLQTTYAIYKKSNEYGPVQKLAEQLKHFRLPDEK